MDVGNSGSNNDNTGDNGRITIEITEDLRQLGIVTNFIFDRKFRQLILSLNHKYKNKTIISPVFQTDWPKTIQKFKGQTTSKGVTENHAELLCDTVDNSRPQVR